MKECPVDHARFNRGGGGGGKMSHAESIVQGVGPWGWMDVGRIWKEGRKERLRKRELRVVRSRERARCHNWRTIWSEQ